MVLEVSNAHKVVNVPFEVTEIALLGVCSAVDVWLDGPESEWGDERCWQPGCRHGL